MMYGIIAIVLVIIALVAISIFIKQKASPKAKGERGESAVAKILGDTVIGEQYVINDLLFCNELGQSCQIDHIYINKNGMSPRC